MQSLVDRYRRQIHPLTHGLELEQWPLHELHEIIDRCFHESENLPEMSSFFSAERAFYEKQYKTAVKHYLEAKGLPQHQFFCYRASAYLFHSLGQADKALEFAQKAIQLAPSDPLITTLMRVLAQPPSLPDSEVSPKISLGQEELEEISDMFNETLDMADSLEESPHIEEVSPAQKPLQTHIQTFQREQQARLEAYFRQADQRTGQQEPILLVLDGWESEQGDSEWWLSGGPKQTSGGYFIRWNGKGIAINPGAHFLKRFHRAGLHIRDIDFVVVTKPDIPSYRDVQAIYNLNYRLNSGRRDLHIIHYYLHRETHQDIARSLAPRFKQERDSVHCLELYLDSPELERIDLSNGIILHYFPTARDDQQGALGIRFDLQTDQGAPICLGYAPAPLSPHLAGCDILVAALSGSSKGAFPMPSSEIDPKLLLCSEFHGSEGDLRLETVKQMRQQWAGSQTVILPTDTGLCISLQPLGVHSCARNAPLDPQSVHVYKSTEAFGPLGYVGPECVL